MSTDLPIYEVPPSVDDEATVTVRIRLASPQARDAVAEALTDEVPGMVGRAVRKLLLSQSGAHLAGVEVNLPDFKPYAYARREVLPPIPEQP